VLLRIFIGTVLLLLVATACSSVATVEPSATGTPGSTPGSQPTPTPEPSVGNQVGERIPGFTLTFADGSEATLDSLLATGKPVLLYYFATW
jgi:cytochrome oxidase Cu insertion factor (SCO1/SenC/PrrC family)